MKKYGPIFFVVSVLTIFSIFVVTMGKPHADELRPVSTRVSKKVTKRTAITRSKI